MKKDCDIEPKKARVYLFDAFERSYFENNYKTIDYDSYFKRLIKEGKLIEITDSKEPKEKIVHTFTHTFKKPL